MRTQLTLITLAAIGTTLFAVDAHAQCLHPTVTPSVPVTSVPTTTDAACNIGDANACGGGQCSPDYYTVEWQDWMCLGGLLHGRTWGDGDQGWAVACVAWGGVPLPQNHFCTTYNTAHCTRIECSGSGQCPTEEFCAGDGVCHGTYFCTDSSQCGEWVCVGGLCENAADLVVSSIQLVPSAPHANQSFTVYVTVGNVGPGPSIGSSVQIRVGGETVGTFHTVNGLQPGGLQTVARVTSLRAGNFRITAIADPYNVVPEGSGEGNNVQYRNLTVAP